MSLLYPSIYYTYITNIRVVANQKLVESANQKEVALRFQKKKKRTSNTSISAAVTSVCTAATVAAAVTSDCVAAAVATNAVVVATEIERGQQREWVKRRVGQQPIIFRSITTTTNIMYSTIFTGLL